MTICYFYDLVVEMRNYIGDILWYWDMATWRLIYVGWLLRYFI